MKNNGELLSELKSKLSKVTVVVVNWNGQDFIEKCLNALRLQTVTPNEIIVVDNASTDRSIEIIQKFPEVRLIALTTNTGFAVANNLAISVASKESDWIALINPDAFAAEDWLETLMFATIANPRFDVFGSKLICANETNLLDGAGDIYHMTGLVWRMGHGADLRLHSENTYEIFSPCAGAALYRRSALIETGGFDEDFFCYVEDVDLGFRLRLAGYRCLYIPGSVAYHIGSGTIGGANSDFAVYHGHRNLVWTFIKNMPGILFWLLLPMHIILNLSSVALFAIRGQGDVILRAKKDAIFGISKSWQKRQHIQRNRVATISAIWRQIDKRIVFTKTSRSSQTFKSEQVNIVNGK